MYFKQTGTLNKAQLDEYKIHNQCQILQNPTMKYTTQLGNTFNMNAMLGCLCTEIIDGLGHFKMHQITDYCHFLPFIQFEIYLYKTRLKYKELCLQVSRRQFASFFQRYGPA